VTCADAGRRYSGGAVNSHMPPASSMSPAGCGDAPPREDHERAVSGCLARPVGDGGLDRIKDCRRIAAQHRVERVAQRPAVEGVHAHDPQPRGACHGGEGLRREMIDTIGPTVAVPAATEDPAADAGVVRYFDDDSTVEGEPFPATTEQGEWRDLVFQGAGENDDVSAAPLDVAEAVDPGAVDAVAALAAEREVGELREVVRDLDSDRLETVGDAARQPLGDPQGESALGATDINEPDRPLGGAASRIAEHPPHQGGQLVAAEEPVAKRFQGAAKGVEERLAAADVPRSSRHIKRHRRGVALQGRGETKGAVGVVHDAASQRGVEWVECERTCASPTGFIGKALPVSLVARVMLIGNGAAPLARLAPTCPKGVHATQKKRAAS